MRLQPAWIQSASFKLKKVLVLKTRNVWLNPLFQKMEGNL